MRSVQIRRCKENKQTVGDWPCCLLASAVPSPWPGEKQSPSTHSGVWSRSVASHRAIGEAQSTTRKRLHRGLIPFWHQLAVPGLCHHCTWSSSAPVEPLVQFCFLAGHPLLYDYEVRIPIGVPTSPGLQQGQGFFPLSSQLDRTRAKRIFTGGLPQKSLHIHALGVKGTEISSCRTSLLALRV